MTQYKIAVIAGDGIGKEVMPEGIRVRRGRSRQVRLRFSGTKWTGAATTISSTGA